MQVRKSVTIADLQGKPAYELIHEDGAIRIRSLGVRFNPAAVDPTALGRAIAELVPDRG